MAPSTTTKPGPWHFRPVTEHEHGGQLLALLLETKAPNQPHNDPCILAVREDWTDYLFRNPQGQAHARLITAAPALRDALQALLDWGREHTSPRDPNSPHDLLVAAAEALRHAAPDETVSLQPERRGTL